MKKYFVLQGPHVCSDILLWVLKKKIVLDKKCSKLNKFIEGFARLDFTTALESETSIRPVLCIKKSVSFACLFLLVFPHQI